ncbi:MAG: 16S rRNA (cytidine(1402)-2'-O)-methyltransferase [Deltaproteobacteria bacterium]|nr:16S rRNA (cytidine(1402)-2'-O)-methyltransferase [Deltaproteobacteria bacterium]
MRPQTNPDPAPAGRLFVVATPIGHLGDLTVRAGQILAQVDLVAAEDTRRTRKLLSHLGVKVSLVSYRQHNQARAGPKLIKALEAGQDVALVTDAGTPSLSDPGRDLIKAALEARIKVIPLPGPSAVAAALSVSGLNADRFTFAGFLPAKAKARQELLEKLASRPETLVFFEAPHRLAESLADMAQALGPRRAVVCRELTKLNEEIIRADLVQLRAWAGERQVKGEVTLVVAGAEPNRPPADSAAVGRAWAECRSRGLSAAQAAKEVAQVLGLPRTEVYRLGLAQEEEKSES